MAKAPASQFYWGDLKRDVEYHLMSFEARGVWMEMLTCMWDAKDRGKITGTIDQLSILTGCPREKLISSVVEIYATKTGEVSLVEISGDISLTRFCNANVTPSNTPCNDVLQALHETDCNIFVTLINRRMLRDEKVRKSTYSRVIKHRTKEVKRPCNGKVTFPSSSSSSLKNKEGDVTHDVTLQKLPKAQVEKLLRNCFRIDNGNYVCPICKTDHPDFEVLKIHLEQEH